MGALITIVITVVLSAFFSGMEIAFISANKLRIEIDKKRGHQSSSILSIFTKYPSRYIATMLIGNNIALVIYGMVMAGILTPFFYGYSDGTILFFNTIISTLIILLIAEFLPKTLFRINPNRVLKIFAAPVIFFYYLFYPISKFSTWLSDITIKLFFGVDTKNINRRKAFDRFDLNDLISEHPIEGDNALQMEKDVKIFKNALDFSKVKIKECTIPRNELVAVDANESMEIVLQRFSESGHSRLLVYNESIDNIIGYVHTIDLLKSPLSLNSIVHSMPIVPETMPAQKLMAKFTAKKKSIALVVDEFGGTAGIVTLEDIIEEIFGEIEDEHDTNEFVDKQISDTHFIFSGRLEIDYLNEKYNLQFPVDETYETLAGFILNYTEDIPDVNKVITIGNFRFQIIKASGARIEEVELNILE